VVIGHPFRVVLAAEDPATAAPKAYGLHKAEAWDSFYRAFTGQLPPAGRSWALRTHQGIESGPVSDRWASSSAERGLIDGPCYDQVGQQLGPGRPGWPFTAGISQRARMQEVAPARPRGHKLFALERTSLNPVRSKVVLTSSMKPVRLR